jgi:hypothetical protein
MPLVVEFRLILLIHPDSQHMVTLMPRSHTVTLTLRDFPVFIWIPHKTRDCLIDLSHSSIRVGNSMEADFPGSGAGPGKRISVTIAIAERATSPRILVVGCKASIFLRACAMADPQARSAARCLSQWSFSKIRKNLVNIPTNCFQYGNIHSQCITPQQNPLLFNMRPPLQFLPVREHMLLHEVVDIIPLTIPPSSGTYASPRSCRCYRRSTLL